MTRLAVIAGAGGLPAALVAGLAERPLICSLEGFAPAGLVVDKSFRIERLALFLRWLEDEGVTCVTFAGAVQRPRLDPSLFDPETATLVPRLLAAMGQGDDATLREVLAIFGEFGFAVQGVCDLAPHLVPGAGIYAGSLTPRDEADAARAAHIVAALGAADIGQGCVVAGGLCLAVETLPGTDAMLAFVAGLPGALRPAKGVFYKAPKPDQDRRVDLPTLGLQTLDKVHAAGLAGIVWQADGVICLDLPAMQVRADSLGLFLWAR
jgi:UDP-2,3-diacylglucosamine hydrolase